jgi:hypothetical protein
VLLDADGSTTVAVIDGIVTVSGVDVLHGLMVIIGTDGSVSDPDPIPEDLLNSDWFIFNQCELDDECDCVLGETVEAPPEPEEPAEEPSETPTVEQIDENAAPGDYPPAATTCGATIGPGANQITVSGDGYAPGEQVTITLDGEVIGEAVADENGSFTVVTTLQGVATGPTLSDAPTSGAARSATTSTSWAAWSATRPSPALRSTSRCGWPWCWSCWSRASRSW